jgi:broad specificity phosphatase PhoE
VPLDLYLVRHGGTEWTQTGQHTSRTDLPLLPMGEEEARKLARHLRGIQFAAVFSSDRQRAIRTAELAGFPNPQVTPLLREFDYGDCEGLTSEEIWRKRPDWQLFEDGCPGGETPDQVYARARAFLDSVAGLDGAVAAFSHGHFLRTLGVAWLDLDVRVAARLALDTAAVCVLRSGSRGRLLHRWNWVEQLAVS